MQSPIDLIASTVDEHATFLNSSNQARTVLVGTIKFWIVHSTNNQLTLWPNSVCHCVARTLKWILSQAMHVWAAIHGMCVLVVSVGAIRAIELSMITNLRVALRVNQKVLQSWWPNQFTPKQVNIKHSCRLACMRNACCDMHRGMHMWHADMHATLTTLRCHCDVVACIMPKLMCMMLTCDEMRRTCTGTSTSSCSSECIASETASELQSIRVRAQVRPLPTQFLTLGRKSIRQYLTHYNKKGNVPNHKRLKLSFCMNPPGRSWIKR